MCMQASRVLFLMTLTLLTFSSFVVGENWPSWRGPIQNGVSSETGLPTEWSATKNVAWKLPLPGPAGATPVVWEDRIFLTAAEGKDLVLMCVSTSGKQLWKEVVATGNQLARGDEGNSASPSPVTDGKHVWTFMGTGDLACYDNNGEKVWAMNLQKKYGKFDIQFGMTSTPVLDGDHLIVMLMHGSMRNADPGYSKLICLNKKTGREVWQHDRKSEATHENKHSYASPFIYDDGNLRYLLAHGADYTTAHSLKDGREIWRCGDLHPKKGYNKYLRFVSSPGFGDGVVIIPTAKDGPLVAVDAHAKGNITGKEADLWRRDRDTPDVPCPLVVDGLVYICTQNGNFYCHEAKTGKEIYGLQRTERQRHRASPVYADGKIFTTARNGIITVIKAGRDFEILAQNDLGESISSSPAISNGVIYIRSFDHLWAIKK